MEVQSVLIYKFTSVKKKSFTEAYHQLLRLGFAAPYGVDETDRYYRFRQRNPIDFQPKSFRMHEIKKNNTHIGYFILGKIKPVHI